MHERDKVLDMSLGGGDVKEPNVELGEVGKT